MSKPTIVTEVDNVRYLGIPMTHVHAARGVLAGLLELLQEPKAQSIIPDRTDRPKRTYRKHRKTPRYKYPRQSSKAARILMEMVNNPMTWEELDGMCKKHDAKSVGYINWFAEEYMAKHGLIDRLMKDGTATYHLTAKGMNRMREITDSSLGR